MILDQRKRAIQVLKVLQLAKLWPQSPRNVRVTQIPENSTTENEFSKVQPEIEWSIPKSLYRKDKIKKFNTRKKKRNLQTDHMVIGVAGNVEPGAGIDQSWVPALQNIGGVREPASQSMQSISWKKTQKQKNNY